MTIKTTELLSTLSSISASGPHHISSAGFSDLTEVSSFEPVLQSLATQTPLALFSLFFSEPRIPGGCSSWTWPLREIGVGGGHMKVKSLELYKRIRRVGNVASQRLPL